MSDADIIERAAELVGGATQVTVLTGAGISTDSGLPDFRGPNGLWTKNPGAEKASNIEYYVADPSVRRANWAMRAAGQLWANVEPNAGHRALLPLQARGVLHTLVTQNVDELHQRAGIDPGRVVEIHGTTRKVQCLSCAFRADMETALERVRAGDEDPQCLECGGLLKSATISFGQALVPEDLDRAERAAVECDLLLAIGSSLQVYPIAGAVPLAVQNGASLVIVNGEPTPFDSIADVVVPGSISEVLPRIVGP